ncbi:MAG TPA: peptidylprolyl isomerase [Burkholderiales bacterium]|nr:peptidylprolyl isomerase [Burkholderiales bacterium]
MFTRSLVLLLCLLAWLPAALGQRAALVDRIVAVVNKEVITASELHEATASAERALGRRGTQLPPRELLERQMLERLILDKAQLQMAREMGIRVDELQLDRAVQRVAEQNRLTLAEFRGALERDGVAFGAYREDLREQIILSRLREREVSDRIQVSDGEIDLLLEEMKAAPAERVEFNLAHVLVRIPEQASPERIEAARGRAEKVVLEARAGTDFGRLAASYSDAPDALQGGALGWRARDRLPDLFVSALAKMSPGEVSEVLRSPAGFHVVKLLERRGAGGPAEAGVPVLQTRLRHILIRTSDSVSEDDARRRLLTLRERIVGGGADFAEMARVHSDDGTAARGGELDWIYPGDTVPDFERGYVELKIGEVSEPVRTPFGYHLIQVLERRSADMSLERRRMQARQTLRERKMDDAYQEWLRLVRDQTYVELRLEEK